MFIYFLGIFATVAVFAIIIQLVRSDRLKERQAIWWLIASTFSVIVSIFPETLDFFASSLGFEVPANLAFFISIALLCIVTLQLSADLNKTDERVRSLAERIAIIESKTLKKKK